MFGDQERDQPDICYWLMTLNYEDLKLIKILVKKKSLDILGSLRRKVILRDVFKN